MFIVFHVDTGSAPLMICDSAAFQKSHTDPISGMLGIGTPFFDDSRKPAMIGSDATSSASDVYAGMRGSAS